ncbi:hypothetical protein [Leyella stercorea]|uniref:hypothetical protein n=1 Tax=Leyella stercorea TaxID=363265 RepID=UPI001F27EDBC|nr:hypothetical protein [Leyella stercorea]
MPCRKPVAAIDAKRHIILVCHLTQRITTETDRKQVTIQGESLVQDTLLITLAQQKQRLDNRGLATTVQPGQHRQVAQFKTQMLMNLVIVYVK